MLRKEGLAAPHPGLGGKGGFRLCLKWQTCGQRWPPVQGVRGGGELMMRVPIWAAGLEGLECCFHGVGALYVRCHELSRVLDAVRISRGYAFALGFQGCFYGIVELVEQCLDGGFYSGLVCFRWEAEQGFDFFPS